MADTKISEMTAATSLADADLVPVVQGGVNKRGTVDLILDGITAARVNTALGYTAANDAALNASNLTSGTVPDARFPATLPAASGVNLTNLVATNIATGLVPTARLGGGTASSSTYLRGDQTWATVTAGVDGSGTANQIPTWSDTDTLAGSKMTASGTNGGTWTLYDDTATVGVTRLIVRAGAGQGTTSLFEVIDSGSASAFKVNANGSGDIGISDAATNTVSDAMILRHATSGTATTGFGTGLLFQGENAAGNMHDMASIDAVYANAADTNEEAHLVFKNYHLGAEATFLTMWQQFGETYLVAPTSLGLIGSSHVRIQTQAAAPIYFATGYVDRWLIESSGHLQPNLTNTYDIGTSTLAVKDIYVEDVLTSHVKMGPSYSSFDAGVTRSSAGVLKVTDGSTGFGSLRAAALGAETSNGAISNIRTVSESITLSTSGLTTDSTADLLPANSIILAVTARVTTAITTTTDWALGDAMTSNRFSAPNTTLAAGTTVVGVRHQQGSVTTDATGPVQTSAGKLRITCTGPNPGAGAVRVTVTYLELTPPTS